MATRAELLRRLKRLERPAVDQGALLAELNGLRAMREAEAARALAPGASIELVQGFLQSLTGHGRSAADQRIAELERLLSSPADQTAAAARQAEIKAMSRAELAALVAERQGRHGATPAG